MLVCNPALWRSKRIYLIKSLLLDTPFSFQTCPDVKRFKKTHPDKYGTFQRIHSFQSLKRTLELILPDSTSPNPDCIVKMMNALVKIQVASSELSDPASSAGGDWLEELLE